MHTMKGAGAAGVGEGEKKKRKKKNQYLAVTRPAARHTAGGISQSIAAAGGQEVKRP